MKKVFVYFIILMTAAVMIPGCQPTPGKPVVVQKDMEQMIEKAQATPSAQNSKALSLRERLNAPDTYTANFEGYNGDLKVNADAKVTVPDSDGLSVMRVSRHYFTQEEADSMIEVFLQGAAVYKADDTLTKQEIQDKLVTYYGIRDGSVSKDILGAMGYNPNDDEQLKKTIEYYEGLLAKAPETKEQTPADMTLHASDAANNPDARIIEGTATVNGRPAYVYINNGFSNVNDVEAVFINAKQPLDGRYNSCPYTILSDEELSGVNIPETFTMAAADAQSVAEQVLKALGIKDMACVDTMYAVIPAEGASANAAPGAIQLEQGTWAYSLQFQRTVNGIPVTLTDYAGNSVNYDDDVSVPWPYERLSIIVDEMGVVYFDYMSPYTIEDAVTENASLLDFPSVASVFEKMLPIAFGYLDEEGADYHLQADLTEARLGLMRITEQNSRDSGLLIPVWDFFGDIATVSDSGESHKKNEGTDSLFTINAIDGTVIDRNLGY